MTSPGFQSTPPARGATIARGQRGGCTADKAVFQSTPPARGATVFDGPLVGFGDISIHAPREGGDISVAFMLFLLDISIHAPREGGDYHTIKKKSRIFNFNPRPPRGGRLPQRSLKVLMDFHFNPRPPRGGRRAGLGFQIAGKLHFNPRPPRGGRRCCFAH